MDVVGGDHVEALGDGQLDEGVQIMRDLWTTGTSTLDGKHYQTSGAILRPLPPQQGGIPLWIAGGGEKKTLRIAAKYAKYTNFAADQDRLADAVSHLGDLDQLDKLMKISVHYNRV